MFEVEATVVEAEFQKLYSFLFNLESGGYSVEEMDRQWPTAIFVVNFDKVLSMDPEILKHKSTTTTKPLYHIVGSATWINASYRARSQHVFSFKFRSF